MNTRLPLLAACLLSFASQAQESKVQMWTWKDANGVVHYSDTPGPGAVKVDINVSPGQPGAAPSSGSRNQGEGRGEGEPPRDAAQAVTYSMLAITQPANETSYFDADAVVEVQINSEPSLADGDSLYLYVDGKRVGNSGDALSYSLSNVERGAHSINAVIFDAQGKEKIRSQPVVFYMKQTTINSPANTAPGVKPRPKPTPHG
jgi:hypothetical protein